MTCILDTERLRLKEFTTADTDFIIALLNSPGWLQFIGDRNVRTKEEAVHYLENGPIKSYREHGFGLWMVELKERNIPIGMCGIIAREKLDKPDIGFAFLPEHNGKGYAYEIAAATLDYAKEQLNIPVIYAITVPDNSNSIRLIEKIGLGYVKTFRFEGDDEELLLYSSEKSISI